MNRRTIVIAAVFLFLCAVLFLLLQGPADPVYQGKPLSYWLNQAQAAGTRGEPGTVAVEHCGAEAEPMLKALLRAHDTKLGLRLQQLLAKQSLIKFKFEPASNQNERGLIGCSILGPKVHGAVPAVVEFVHRKHNISYRSPSKTFALDTLAVMGPKGIEAIVNELDSEDLGISLRAAELLGAAPGANTPVVRAALQKCASSSDPNMRATAAHALELNQLRDDQNIAASATNWTAEADASLANVWDANEGLRLLATSGAQKNLGNSAVLDLFGGRESRFFTGETGCTIFENNSDGFTHFVEWETPQPVTLRSFGFIAMHDGANAGFQRAMRAVRLFTRSASGEEWKPIYVEELTVPYGAGEHHSMLFLFRNLESSVTASQFRAEFVQHGSGMYSGPRVTQLYGFGSKLNWPMISAAIANQPPTVQADVRRFFGKE